MQILSDQIINYNPLLQKKTFSYDILIKIYSKFRTYLKL